MYAFAASTRLGVGARRDIVPIPGTKRMKFLEENIGALAVGLQPEELERINRVLPAGAASGQRYPEAVMAAVNR
ncbi:MAG: hypothetical protein JO108_36575 [Acidobacteriaceae bacterium]|nr:hypothetical protein [Acidobacteriaceae bacterium]